VGIRSWPLPLPLRARIRAIAPDTYKIDPELGGLEWAKGTYPTPYGIIEVNAKKTEEKLLSRFPLPRESR
jgi:hypothetical protein